MNYQVAPFWINSGKLACLIVISLFLAFFSVSTFIAYLLVIGVGWAVLVSFKIHAMKEKGVILKNSDTSDWKVYIQGIPVEEKRQTLANPCFATLQHAQSFFSNAFMIRVLIQVIFCSYILWQIWGLDNINVQILTLIGVVYLGYTLWVSIQRYITLKQGNLIIEELTAPSGSLWYRVYFKEKEKLFPALDGLFAI